ncbi:hypothetical protein LguiB_032080 [Lonicera macranthoides]
MGSCFQSPILHVHDHEDSMVLFSSTSNSPEHSTTTTTHSSTSGHSPPPPPPPQPSKPTYKLSVHNLSYTINQTKSTQLPFFSLFSSKPKPMTILKSVSFVAKSSEILAIVGPSGTGKSTLLKILSGRVKDKHFNPKTVTLNDHFSINSASELRKICGFVPQDDNLLPLLTVKETLMFSAEFRLRETTNRKEREERVDSLMHELGLMHVGDSFVGDEENRGISGGERKRVSIGVDMIHDPPVLLLDEPTSGLDSASALQVIELLSAMAKAKQRTIVISIHQPSYRILEYISRFLILSRGSVAHNGSLESLVETIHRLGFKIPVQINALEFSMEIIHKLEDAYTNPANQTLNMENGDHASYPITQMENEKMGSSSFSHLFEIKVLCHRFWKIIYRTKQLFLARTMQALVGGIGLGSVYIKMKRNEEGIAERLGLFAFSLSFLLSSTVEALPIYLQERRVLMKEASRGAYKISSYMIANTIVFLPFLFAVAIIFSTPVYWLVGLNPSISAFAFFTFAVWLIVLMASSLVLFLSAVSPDFISGNSLICTVLGAFFLFSGYFIPKEIIPKYWIFMYYVSLYRYPLDSLLINEYWSLRDECFTHDLRDNSMCLVTGKDVLKSRGLEEQDTRWINVGIMFGFFVFYRVLCWVILARRVSKTTI